MSNRLNWAQLGSPGEPCLSARYRLLRVIGGTSAPRHLGAQVDNLITSVEFHSPIVRHILCLKSRIAAFRARFPTPIRSTFLPFSGCMYLTKKRPPRRVHRAFLTLTHHWMSSAFAFFLSLFQTHIVELRTVLTAVHWTFGAVVSGFF